MALERRIKVLAERRVAEALRPFAEAARSLPEPRLRSIRSDPPPLWAHPEVVPVPGGYKIYLGSEDLYLTPTTLGRFFLAAQRAMAEEAVKSPLPLERPYGEARKRIESRTRLLEEVAQAALRFWKEEIA